MHNLGFLSSRAGAGTAAAHTRWRWLAPLGVQAIGPASASRNVTLSSGTAQLPQPSPVPVAREPSALSQCSSSFGASDSSIFRFLSDSRGRNDTRTHATRSQSAGQSSRASSSGPVTIVTRTRRSRRTGADVQDEHSAADVMGAPTSAAAAVALPVPPPPAVTSPTWRTPPTAEAARRITLAASASAAYSANSAAAAAAAATASSATTAGRAAAGRSAAAAGAVSASVQTGAAAAAAIASAATTQQLVSGGLSRTIAVASGSMAPHAAPTRAALSAPSSWAPAPAARAPAPKRTAAAALADSKGTAAEAASAGGAPTDLPPPGLTPAPAADGGGAGTSTAQSGAAAAGSSSSVAGGGGGVLPTRHIVVAVDPDLNGALALIYWDEDPSNPTTATANGPAAATTDAAAAAAAAAAAGPALRLAALAAAAPPGSGAAAAAAEAAAAAALWLPTPPRPPADASRWRVCVWDMPVSAAERQKRTASGQVARRRLLHVAGARAVLSAALAVALPPPGEARPVALYGYVEVPPILPGDGNIAAYTSLWSTGTWLGLLTGMGFTVGSTPVRRWKTDLGLFGAQGKDAGLALARAVFPGQQAILRHKKNHGRADALLIAAWALGACLPRGLGASLRRNGITLDQLLEQQPGTVGLVWGPPRAPAPTDAYGNLLTPEQDMWDEIEAAEAKVERKAAARSTSRRRKTASAEVEAEEQGQGQVQEEGAEVAAEAPKPRRRTKKAAAEKQSAAGVEGEVAVVGAGVEVEADVEEEGVKGSVAGRGGRTRKNGSESGSKRSSKSGSIRAKAAGGVGSGGEASSGGSGGGGVARTGGRRRAAAKHAAGASGSESE